MNRPPSVSDFRENDFLDGAAGRERPLERTLKFLANEIARHGERRGRLPTIREVALRLDVSSRTVQKAFHQLSAEGKIESITGRGTFTKPPSRGASTRRLRIGLNIEFDHYDPINAWAYTIYGAILQASLCAGRNAVFTSVEEALRHPGGATPDGFIFLPDAREAARKVGREWPNVPTVYLNPPLISSTSNFVSPDYHRVGFLLGETWNRFGKKRIAFIHHPDLATSSSGQLVVSGMIAGLAGAFNELDYLRALEAEDFTAEAGYRAMRQLLRERKGAPDAVFCKGDFLALGVLKALREAGYAVPGDVSVVGGSGLDLSETDFPRLTRCRQPFQQLGEALVSMLFTRIEQEGACHPGRFFSAPFIGGGTTPPRENEWILQAENPTGDPVVAG